VFNFRPRQGNKTRKAQTCKEEKHAAKLFLESLIHYEALQRQFFTNGISVFIKKQSGIGIWNLIKSFQNLLIMAKLACISFFFHESCSEQGKTLFALSTRFSLF